MATKRKKKSTHRRPRKRALSSGGTTRRRKSRRRSKGMLSELVNPTMAMHAAKATAATVTGAAGAVWVNKMIPPATSKLAKVGLAVAVGFAGHIWGMPNAGSGFTGGMLALTFQNGFMNDDADFADDDVLNDDSPVYLSDAGEPMVLTEGEDGSVGFRYLNDDEIRVLEDNGAFDEYEEA